MKHIGWFTKVLLLVLMSLQVLLAGGTNRTSLFGAKTTSLNGLYFAGIDGISNVFMNPAGLSYYNQKILEVTGFIKQEENVFNGEAGKLHKSILDSDLNLGAGIVWPLTENLTAAFATELLEDFKVNWPYVLLYKQGTSMVSAATDLYNRYQYRYFSPSIGYKWAKFSAGITFNVLNVKNTLAFAQSNFDWIGTQGLPAYQFDYAQKAWTWNTNLGFMYQVNEELRIGVSIVTPISVTLKGDAATKLYQLTDSTDIFVKMESKYYAPWRIGIGSVFHLNEDISFNIDLRYNAYNETDEEIKFIFNNSIWEQNSKIEDQISGVSASSLFQYYNNSIDVGAGVEYQADSDLKIYAGYKFSQSPNTEKSYSLLNPTVSQNQFSCGFSYTSEEVTVEGGVLYYLGVEKSVTGAIYKVNNGRYNVSGVIPTLTLKYKL